MRQEFKAYVQAGNTSLGYELGSYVPDFEKAASRAEINAVRDMGATNPICYKIVKIQVDSTNKRGPEVEVWTRQD